MLFCFDREDSWRQRVETLNCSFDGCSPKSEQLSIGNLEERQSHSELATAAKHPNSLGPSKSLWRLEGSGVADADKTRLGKSVRHPGAQCDPASPASPLQDQDGGWVHLDSSKSSSPATRNRFVWSSIRDSDTLEEQETLDCTVSLPS